VATLLLAGCGGGDEPTSKAQFIAAADKICVHRDASAAALSAVRSDADLGRLSGELAKIYEKAIGDLEAVALPAGDARAGAERYVRATVALRQPIQQMAAASSSLQAAAATRQAGALKDAGKQLQLSVDRVRALGEVADQAAREYRMRDCGQAPADAPVS
jgi:hypothetical protein